MRKILSIILVLSSLQFFCLPVLSTTKSTFDSFKTTEKKGGQYDSKPIKLARRDDRNRGSVDNKPAKYNWVGSFLFPGLGQMVTGYIPRGLLFMTIFTIMGVVSIGSLSSGLGASSLFTFLFGFLGSLTTYIWSIIDAYYNAYKEA